MATVIKYGTYRLPLSPKISVKKSCKKPIPASNASCFFPGFSTFRFLTNRIEIMVSAAIIIQVTTVDSPTGIPPKTGMVKTVSQLSSSVIISAISVGHPPFL